MNQPTQAGPAVDGNKSVTGLVLAGGRGQRMGGVDKGLVSLAGRPMVGYVLDALAPQVANIIINANRSLNDYAEFGFPVISDTSSDFLGPLAGVERGLAAAATDYVITVPCDSPLIEPNLVERLLNALLREKAEIAVAHDGERLQPVFALLQRKLHRSVHAFLSADGRKIDRWFEQHATCVVDFSDESRMFLNVNRPADCAEVERTLLDASSH